MTIRATLLIPALALLAGPGCDRHGRADGDEGRDVQAQDRHNNAEHDNTPGVSAEDSHDHAGAEPSDLDRPVAELFTAKCEHNVRAFECDECRYEVGVARAARDLLDAGLIETEVADRHRMAVPIRLTGEVQFDARRVAHVSVPAEGKISRVLVVLGDEVSQGQALVEIESGAVGEAEAAYLEAQGELSLARKSFERVATLRREQIAAEKELLLARQELEAAEIRAGAALGTLVRLGVDPADARALTRRTARGRLLLRAPASGTILDMHAVAGELARGDEPLLTIGDNATLWVWADLYERDMALLRQRQSEQPLAATVAVKAYPGELFPGTVDFVSPAMHEDSRTVKVRIEVPNPEQKLLAGMFADVEVRVPREGEVIAVPRDAVLEDEGRAFVFLHHHDDFYVRRPVEPGRTWGDRVEVRAGLQGGEVVVTRGAFLMKSDVLRSKMGAGCAD